MVKLRVPADGTHIALPGEVVMAVPPGAVATIGCGLRILPAKVSPSPSVGSKRPRTSVLDDDEETETAATDGAVEDTLVVAAVMGPFMKDKTNQGTVRFYIPTPAVKRYTPHLGDAVVGAVVKINSTSYIVNIGSSHPATLSVIAFDGATKNNRPRLKVGDVLYAHISQCERDLDVELSCCATQGMVAKDWVTGEAVFGLLCGGLVIALPLFLCQELYTNASPLLAQLGDRIPFDICVGLNGRAWVKAGGTTEKTIMTNSIAIKRVLEEAADGGDVAGLMNSMFPGAESSPALFPDALGSGGADGEGSEGSGGDIDQL